MTSQGVALARDLERSGILRGIVLRTWYRGGADVRGSMRDFPASQSLGRKVRVGAGEHRPCTALWGSRREDQNLGALEGLDSETGWGFWLLVSV